MAPQALSKARQTPVLTCRPAHRRLDQGHQRQDQGHCHRRDPHVQEARTPAAAVRRACHQRLSRGCAGISNTSPRSSSKSTACGTGSESSPPTRSASEPPSKLQSFCSSLVHRSALLDALWLAACTSSDTSTSPTTRRRTRSEGRIGTLASHRLDCQRCSGALNACSSLQACARRREDAAAVQQDTPFEARGARPQA